MEINGFQFIITPVAELLFPSYKGSAFRGGFGNCLKRAFCILKQDCDETRCPVVEKCLFKRIFEPKELHGEPIKTRNIPTPYLIEPPETEKEMFKAGEEIIFYLILFGRIIEYLPYFIFAFELLGNVGIGKGRGKFDVKEVRAIGSREVTGIYNGETKILNNKRLPIYFEGMSFSETDLIKVKFLTPTHIKSGGKVLHSIHEFTFFRLLKAVLNRLSSLSYFYGKEKFNWDYEGLLKGAEKIKTVKEKSYLKWAEIPRYSMRMEREDLLSGVKGEMVYAGPNLNLFLSYLRFGEYAHVGNRTTFGLGKFKIINPD